MEDKVGKYIENNKMIDLDEEIEDIKEEWKQFFKDHKKEIEEMFKNIGTSYYFPRRKDVFRVFKKGEGPSLDNLKCVVVGMDPYYSYDIDDGNIVPVATGRSFEVAGAKEWKNLNKSLENILKTIYFNKFGVIDQPIDKTRKDKKFHISESPSDWFEKTEKQGVLWLNIALTVEPYKPGSHIDLWKDFMTKLIKHIDDMDNKNELTWVLWGDDAQKLFNEIDKNSKERIRVESVHPASRKKDSESFIEMNCFEKLSEIINWEC